MRERLERSESDLRGLESQTEQVEQRLEEIEKAIEEIESAISRLEGRGDQEVATSFQRSLAQKQQEKAQEERLAEGLVQQLEQISSEIHEVDQLNNEARNEIATLERLGEDVGGAASIVAERERLAAEQEGRCRDLRQRLSRLSGGSGFG